MKTCCLAPQQPLRSTVTSIEVRAQACDGVSGGPVLQSPVFIGEGQPGEIDPPCWFHAVKNIIGMAIEPGYQEDVGSRCYLRIMAGHPLDNGTDCDRIKAIKREVSLFADGKFVVTQE